MKRKQLAMVIDAEKCLDCKACQAACKVANKVPGDNWRNWIKNPGFEEPARQRGPMVFQPGNCMQCSDPLCVKACPTGATYRSEKDGLVIINQDLCIGCGQCLPACPYGARYRHPVKRKADKCDFCAERRAAGLEPACVSTCPTKTRVFGDLTDPTSAVYQLRRQNRTTQVVNAKTNTDPNIYYLGDPGLRDWPVEAKMPTAFAFWKNLAGPVVNLVVGLSALGVGAMFVKQLLLPVDQPLQDEQEERGHHE